MQPTACCPETGVVHSSLEILSCKTGEYNMPGFNNKDFYIIIILEMLAWPDEYLRLALALPTFSQDTKYI